MRRWLVLLLVLLGLLTGCAGEPEPQTEPTDPIQTTVPITEPQPQPQTFGTYEPRSYVEVLTAGAVKRYSLEASDYYSLAMMGQGLLLFSGDEETTLTYLSREQDPVSVTLTGCYIRPEEVNVRISEKGIGYYDSNDHTLVFLDLTLQETTRVSLPTDMVCDPVLSEDWKWVYYYVSDSLRSLELRTGISRLLQESSFSTQQVQQIYFDGMVLECRTSDGENEKTVLISTETGKTLETIPEQLDLRTTGQRFFSRWYETDQWKLLFGNRGDKTQRLELTGEGTYFPQLSQNALIVSRGDETGTTLARYALEDAQPISAVRLAGVGEPLGVATEEDTGLLWFLSDDVWSESQALYCWDYTLSLTEEKSQVLPYYTGEEPDVEGLNNCEKLVDELGKRYGVRIRLWKDAVSVVPEDYTFTLEYQVPVYQQCLVDLEQALEAFPKELFVKLGKKSQNGRLTVSLVKEAYGSNELGSQTVENGVHFWSDGSAYLTLVMNDRLEQTFNHELFHAIDSYVLTECKVYDFWEDLNPKGFAYDYSYITNEYREADAYLENETRSFIDVYSMSYPKEDRARIMEYAMLEGKESYFKSATMRKKLETLCRGIRVAFDLEDDSRVFPWEQYLQ